MRLIYLIFHLIYIVLFIGIVAAAMYQFFRIVTDYYDYDVINEIRTGQEEKIVFPDISLCASINRFINFTLLEMYHPSIVKYMREHGNVTDQDKFLDWTTSSNEGRDYFKHQAYQLLTVKELLRASYNGSTLITQLDISFKASFVFMENSITNSLCKKTSFIKGLDTCVGIHCSAHREYILSREDIVRTAGIMARIFLNRRAAINLDSIDVYLHSPNSFPRGLQIPYATIPVRETEAGREYWIDYSMIQNQLLKPPYKTKCFNYSEHGFDGIRGFESQLHKMEECWNRESMKKVNCFFRNSIEYSHLNVSLAYVYYNDIYKRLSKQIVHKEIFEKCRNIAPYPDCKSELYMPVLRRDVDYREGKYKIQLVLPTGSSIINLSKEKENFWRFLLLMGNVLGAHFGFSVLWFLKELKEKAIWFSHKIYMRCWSGRVRKRKLKHMIKEHNLSPLTRLNNYIYENTFFTPTETFFRK